MFEDILLSPTTALLFGLIVALLVPQFSLLQLQFTRKKGAPGPRPLPLFGNLLQVDLRRLDQSLCNLSKKYGPVFQVFFGPKKVVVLAGYRTVKQALVNHADEFGNREITPVFYDFNKGHGKPFSNNKAINYAASNVISALMFGKRFEYSDPIFQAMVERDNETIHLTGSPSLLLYNLCPWLGPFLKNWRDLIKNVEDGKRDVRMIIKNLKETLDPGVCRCFVDAFLTRKKHLEDSEVLNLHYHDDNLLHSVMNLFAAGTDTTATTLKWCLLYMAKFPDVQERVLGELSMVVGSRQVRAEDRKNLPYTDAVIHESQRLANIVPMALPHALGEDITFQGYFIKEVCCLLEGTTVVPLLTSVLYDDTEWENPPSFSPSHFLDGEGRFVRREAFMPFSAGRRACLGESLARMELFLFFTSLLQHFRFTAPPGVSEDQLDLTPVVGVTLAPTPQKLCAVRRH